MPKVTPSRGFGNGQPPFESRWVVLLTVAVIAYATGMVLAVGLWPAVGFVGGFAIGTVGSVTSTALAALGRIARARWKSDVDGA